MLRTLTFCLFMVSFLTIQGQENFNLELITQIEIDEDASDIWGYVDESGTEYAIMGSRTSTIIWSLEDPTSPIERARIDGAASIWRDIKFYEDHIYVTADQGSDGLLIIDMSLAPDTITHEFWKPELSVGTDVQTLRRCHNLYIDTEVGTLFLSGCNVSNRGVMLFDLNENKKEPVYQGAADLEYSHDVYADGNVMYASELTNGFNLYDISDPTNPTLMNGALTTNEFTHNAWASPDGNFLFTTDEEANAFVDSYDISDPDNIQFLDRYQPFETQGSGVIPHNTHYLDGFLITSWYTDGIVINDVTKPDNIVKVGAYDTELVLTSGFEGTWGAYPYLPSGLVLGSDINNGLFIFRPVDSDGQPGYQRACYLEGKVTDKNTGAAIPNVKVQIVNGDPNDEQTDLMGDYKTGQVTSGEFEVLISHPNYDPVQETVTLITGEVTILDVQLGAASVSGIIKDKVSGLPIENAEVVLVSSEDNAETIAKTDDSGTFVLSGQAGNDYTFAAAKWGYKGASMDFNFTDGGVLELELEPGYQDHFFADLGWTVDHQAASGIWERGTPQEIFFGNEISQIGEDVPGDILNAHYATGFGGPGGGDDDIDDGTTFLISPVMDFTTYDIADFSFQNWFYNAGGQGDPANDYFSVSISNENETLELYRDSSSSSEWSDLIELSITNLDIEFTSDMRLIVQAADDDPGHISEAAFDNLNVELSNSIVSTINFDSEMAKVYPNPAFNRITLQLSNEDLLGTSATVINSQGQVISSFKLTKLNTSLDVSVYPVGIYTIQMTGPNAKQSLRFAKQ